MDQKYLTDSESLSLNIEATCMLLSSPINFPYEIKMDKYRPYPFMISMFTSDSQHPPRSRHAVHLGDTSIAIFLSAAITTQEENDRRNYFMIYLHESMGPGSDLTCYPWICSRTRYRCSRHLNGLSLAGRILPAFSRYWVFFF